MEYIIGILIGILGILLIRDKHQDSSSNEEKEKLKETTTKIESNKEQIKKEEEKLNAPAKKESKSLSELLEYFKRNKR